MGHGDRLKGTKCVLQRTSHDLGCQVQEQGSTCHSQQGLGYPQFCPYRGMSFVYKVQSYDKNFHQGDGFGQNSVVAQRTVRLANVRNGLRRITLRNERDIRPYHMAQVLVDIKVFTMDDIQQEDAKLNHVIEVRFVLYVTSVRKFP